ncbi:hypothetical protein YC2023_116071 [Brassica napus]
MTCSVVDLVCRRRLVLGSVAGVGYVGGRDSSSLLKPLQMIRRYHSGGEVRARTSFDPVFPLARIAGGCCQFFPDLGFRP